MLFLMNFATIFLLFLPFSSFWHTNIEKQIETSVWSAEHPDVGQNIQHSKKLLMKNQALLDSQIQARNTK